MMENTLFINEVPSKYISYTSIGKQNSDEWLKEKLKDLLSSTSIHSFETKCKDGKNYLNLNNAIQNENNRACNKDSNSYFKVNLNTFVTLKESTKQILCLLEEIQSKVRTNNLDQKIKINNIFKVQPNELTSISTDAVDLKELKNYTRKLSSINIKDGHDECSVYKKLIRKCNCLNHPDYNDFIIHFNEDDKHTTNDIGEMIKNMRILKKFLYIGDYNTKNALMFLYEGLLQSKTKEKLEIIQACAFADICNVFEEHSFVTTFISWPCKNKYYGNYVTQNLAAGFLYKFAEMEHGKRYLTYTSKISSDIRKVLRKKTLCLEIDIVNSLNATLNFLKPNFAKILPFTLPMSVYEGAGAKLIKELFQNREYMSFDEIYIYMDLLKSCSSLENNKKDLSSNLPTLLILFKQFLLEYNDSKLNIIVTNILNNIVVTDDENVERTNAVFISTSTEAIQMKNETCQKPPRQTNSKKTKPKNISLTTAPSKPGQTSNYTDLTKPSRNRSSKYVKELRNSFIVVPVEENR